MAEQFGSPTFTRDIAGAIRDFVRADARGILDVTNTGSCSWFEFAHNVLRQVGRGSVFSPASHFAYGIMLRSWQEATGAFLEELREYRKLA